MNGAANASGGLCFAITALLLAACAPRPEVVTLYESSGVPRERFQRLFVVALSGDPDLRAELERRIVRGLAERGVGAIPSYPAFPPGEGMLQEDLDRVSTEAGADGLLIAHVASVDTDVTVEKGREEIHSECRGGDPVDYFLYDHRVLREPDTLRIAHTVVVVTSLYDIAESRRVWTIQSTCFSKSDLRAAALEEARLIVRQLARDGLI